MALFSFLHYMVMMMMIFIIMTIYLYIIFYIKFSYLGIYF